MSTIADITINWYEIVIHEDELKSKFEDNHLNPAVTIEEFSSDLDHPEQTLSTDTKSPTSATEDALASTTFAPSDSDADPVSGGVNGSSKP